MKDLNDAYVRGVINQALLGKITNGVAANRLGISVRYVKKLKARLRANPTSSLSHGNKNRAPANKASKEGGRRFSPSTSRNTMASTSRCLEGRKKDSKGEFAGETRWLTTGCCDLLAN